MEVNPPDKVRLIFDQVVNARIQDMVDVSIQFYKLLNDNPDFAAFFQELMFERYMRGAGEQKGA